MYVIYMSEGKFEYYKRPELLITNHWYVTKIKLGLRLRPIGNGRSLLQIILMQFGYFFFLIFFISGTFFASGTLSGTQVKIRDDPGKSGTYGMYALIWFPHFTVNK